MPPTVFSEADFPSSHRWSAETDSFAPWAVVQASKVFDESAKGLPMGEILIGVAEARRRLGREMGSSAETFGVPRKKRSVTHLTSKHAEIAPRAERDLRVLVEEELWLDHLDAPSRVKRLTRRTHYVTLDHARLETTRVGCYIHLVRIGPLSLEPGTVVLEHTLPDRISPILSDVLDRLERIRQEGGDRREAFPGFVEAMYGYYQAMPYVRGSAGIGRVFFAGLCYALFGRKLPLRPIDLDLFAMTALHQGEFVDDLSRLHHDSLALSCRGRLE